MTSESSYIQWHMNDLAQYIDQTILRPDATREDIRGFLKDVAQYRFKCAVVNPCWVEYARAELPDNILVCSVVGFPLGASSTQAKVYATEDLVNKGCDEIDMVMNIGEFLSNEYKSVAQEIQDIVAAAQGHIVKVIIEACLLTNEQKCTAAKIIMENKAHFVKTSTGFSISGAVIEDVRLLRKTVGPEFGIKASGGIRTFEQATAFLQVGANRLGTSAGSKILQNSPEFFKIK